MSPPFIFKRKSIYVLGVDDYRVLTEKITSVNCQHNDH